MDAVWKEAPYTCRMFDAQCSMRHTFYMWDAGYCLDAPEVMPAGYVSADPYDERTIFTREGV